MTSYLDTAGLIAAIESGGNSHAMRFEPGIYVRAMGTFILQRIGAANKCDNETSRVIYSMSFGLYQIMGFNLYDTDQPLVSDVVTFCNDTAYQTHRFYQYLDSRDINFSIDQLKVRDNAIKFALQYNGSESYADKILAKLA